MLLNPRSRERPGQAAAVYPEGVPLPGAPLVPTGPPAGGTEEEGLAPGEGEAFELGERQLIAGGCEAATPRQGAVSYGASTSAQTGSPSQTTPCTT
ncbi:hypothetical protein Asi03nite_18490 [Actinoplanes siamensis]|uniref:Uncharacterized protein n=1 Tax=Actinoplanes siamensis TaxID=1223317 RepID=A0A919TI67_9ACTN|nr:hypothetical protein Asi03nite_18490 [Actinoplanes siamensis]